MKILIACERSGTVRDAFIARGHEAVSCDMYKSDAGEPHLVGDALKFIDQGWDMMIAHPPCTYLACSGNRWLYNKDGTKNQKRWEKRWDALDFVWKLMSANIDKICIF